MTDGRPVEKKSSLRVRRGVIGILARGAELLLIRRAEGISLGGHWCFPGGHVEHGETPRRALQRELREELGIEVRPEQRLGSIRTLGGRYVLVVWRAQAIETRFRLKTAEIAEARWLTAQQVRQIQPGLASNEDVLQMLGV